jgi:D-alanyl-D-alanine carboxypeptidase
MLHARRTLCASLIATAVGFTAPQINGPAIASTQASAPASGWTNDPSPGLAGQLRAAMRATVRGGATSMIARVDQGRHVVALGVGLARLEPKRAVRANDAVRIGSITKSMLATVALQVAAEGKLHLSDTVEDWLPGLVPDGGRITLRMLLNHTSGIVDYADDTFVDTIIADPYRTWTPRELVALATAHDPLFEPGTSWSYSNTGYVLVGMVLDEATGVSVGRLLAQRVFRPLHLQHTFFATSGRWQGPHAHGYSPPTPPETQYVDTSGWPPTWAWAAGAVVSNASDTSHFYRALLAGQLLERPQLRRMLHAVEIADGTGYGLGILRIDTPCGTVWGHDGSMFGYLSLAVFDRSGHRGAVVFLPTDPDQTILDAYAQVTATAVCGMFGKPVPATAFSPVARAGRRVADDGPSSRRGEK